MTPEVQEPPTRVPSVVAAIALLVSGVAWLVLFVIHLVTGDAPDWLSTWLPLATGVAFVLLGIERLRRATR